MVTFKRLNYRLVYEKIRQSEGIRMSVKNISDATGLGQNSVRDALKFLLEHGFIEEETQQMYFTLPLSQIN